jgi:uncharacterized protein (DUF1778 family)
VNKKIEGMKNLTGAFQDVSKYGAYTGGDIVGNKKIGFEELIGGSIKVRPDDQRMQLLSHYAKAQQKQLSLFLQEQAVDYAQRNSVQADLKLSPERKRSRMNMLGVQIVDRNRMMLQMMQQFEGVMSNEFGVPVRLDKLNINKGVDQFKMP